jgi:hypothetical protein
VYSVVKFDGGLPLPSGFTWRALNDRDEIVGDCNDPAPSDCAAYNSPGRGLIRLMVSGLNLTSALAINNAGWILANASSLGSSTPEAVLLVPGSELTELPHDRSRTQNRCQTQNYLKLDQRYLQLARNRLLLKPNIKGLPRASHCRTP